MQLTAKAEHLARSNEGRVYTKSSSAEFHRANKVTVCFTYTGEVDFAITSCVKCTK